MPPFKPINILLQVNNLILHATLLSALVLTAFGWQANAQVYVNENFNSGGLPANWTVTDGGAATGDLDYLVNL